MSVPASERSFYFRRIARPELKPESNEAIQLARLIFDAAPEFYGLIPLPPEKVLEIIAAQIGLPGGELENLYGFYQGEALVGACTMLPSRRIAAAQMRSAAWILRSLDKSSAQKFLVAVRGFGKGMEEIG